MFDLPEFMTLAKQMNETLQGKTIQIGRLGNSPHKFVWYNRDHDEFERLTKGKIVGKAWAKGKWLFVPLDPDYLLLLGECGGKVLYHAPGSKLPKKYHLVITFEDDSFLTATTQMWGAMELYERGKEQDRECVKGMRVTPIEPEFTFEYFDTLASGRKGGVKGLLTHDQLIPGLGNAIAQDILFRARLHPKYPIADLNEDQRRVLYNAILDTVRQVIEQDGRYDEWDLYGNQGQYCRIMDKNSVGQPCPDCGREVEKLSYLGGTCYFCPGCRKSSSAAEPGPADRSAAQIGTSRSTLRPGCPVRRGTMHRAQQPETNKENRMENETQGSEFIKHLHAEETRDDQATTL